ncbi:GILT-like protein 1 [Thrips palmi]|uniref:GILT-like protein 1 n=1 Tax=Thrips palmi TaxID=161013 RepID=A0A6P8Z9J2_THRPL|nr:GILT-like protein 1 [Thrips palmi]
MAKVAWLLAAVVLVGVAVGQAAHLSASGKVTLQVFYEALCKDSIRFVKDQLKPTYEAVGSERMVVDFVPYGRARTTPSATGYTFECEHGPNECRGNELQACGLARLTDNMKQVKFVYCVETQTDPSRPDNTCITEAGLDPNDINGCTDGTEGQKLLAQLGYKTPIPNLYPNHRLQRGIQQEGPGLGGEKPALRGLRQARLREQSSRMQKFFLFLNIPQKCNAGVAFKHYFDRLHQVMTVFQFCGREMQLRILLLAL